MQKRYVKPTSKNTNKINKYNYIQCKKNYMTEGITEKIKTLDPEKERIFVILLIYKEFISTYVKSFYKSTKVEKATEGKERTRGQDRHHHHPIRPQGSNA